MTGKSGKSMGKLHAVLGGKQGGGSGGGNQSYTKRAGLVFSVSRARSQLRTLAPDKRLMVTATVYLAAVLEYMVAEIVELSGNSCIEAKKRLITPRHLQLAIRNDDELDKLLKDVHITEGGVLPHIHPALEKKKH